MVLPDTQGISLASSKFKWEDIDERVKTLDLNRSKYTQMLYELDLMYNVLSNYKLLNTIKHPFKYNIRVIDVIFLLLLLAVCMVAIASYLVIA